MKRRRPKEEPRPEAPHIATEISSLLSAQILIVLEEEEDDAVIQSRNARVR